MVTRLDAELGRLVDAGVLSPDQANSLRAAVDGDGAVAPAPERRRDSAVTEVLGYVGGVLLLGAVALLVIVSWDEMSRGERIATSLGSAVVLLGASVALAVIRGRDQLASALAALGACVAGFAAYVVIEDTAGRLTGVAVATALSALGLWLLRGALLLVAMFGALSMGAFLVVFDVIDDDGTRNNSAALLGAGFLLVAAVLAVLGLVRDRPTAWSLAGAGVFAASLAWLVQDGGEAFALVAATAGSAALLTAYGRFRTSAYAVVGCAILLVIWPSGLYKLTENVAAVAIGLALASAVLIATVVALSRRRRQTEHAADSRS